VALRFLYVDFNSYFASVEQQLRPELRGKPVGVVPVMAQTTCCIAASYEAKKCGVRTGTLVSEARRLCREIRLIEARPPVYVEYHHKLVEAVTTCLPVEAVLSIDEMVCELTGSQQQRENAAQLAQTVKRAIARDVGSELRCSIGIAPNIFLAKTASDMQKPDGCVILDNPDLPRRLFPLALRELCGVGQAMEKRLNRCGITTVEQLCAASKAELRKAWHGIEGERMYAQLRGEVVPRLPTQRSSIGHSHVLPPQLRSNEAAFSVLHRLLQKAATRLRHYQCVAGGMHVTVKYLHHARWDEHSRFNPTHDTLELLRAFSLLWDKQPPHPFPPMAVGITLVELGETQTRTSSLFVNDKARDRLNAALDRLNARFGRQTVYFGGAHQALGAAPMRIAFNHIPDLHVESDR
jgi:DNA polymerase-4